MSFFYPNLPFIHETDSWYKSPDEKNTTEDPSNGVACKNKKNKRVSVYYFLSNSRFHGLNTKIDFSAS